MHQKTFSSSSPLHFVFPLSCHAAMVALVAFSLSAAVPTVFAQTDSTLKPYVARPVDPPPKDASYLLSDGTIYVVGNDLVEPLFAKFTEIFMQTHPNIKIKMVMPGSPPAIAGITSGKSAFAPMGREAINQDLDGFAARYGYMPLDFLIGYDQSPNPDIYPPGKFPDALWINVKNPLPKLTMQQAARILTTGGGAADITHWSQLGLTGEWAQREIHVYLPSQRDAAFLFSNGYKFGGYPWTRRAEWLPRSPDVMNAVAQDPFGIGFVGYWPPDSGWDRQLELASQAKLVPLAESEGARFSHGGIGDVYPLTGGIRIYVNRAPGKPLESWVKEYIRLALSKDGQDIIASMMKDQGYIPLDPNDVAKELAKLK